MASADLREELSCSVCLDIYKDPVTLRCGHNFCQACITSVLDSQEASGLYTCPECRVEFQERPVMYSARALRNIAEKVFISQPEEKATGFLCTYCVGSAVPAVKSCLLCESSLCGKHLSVHLKSPEHVLSEPTDSWGNRKCSVHKKILEYYCTMERVNICVYCIAVGDHKGHQVESLDVASKKKKKHLRNVLDKLTSVRERTKKQVCDLQKRRTDMEKKAAVVTKKVSDLFRSLRRKLEELEKSVLSEISKEEENISRLIFNLIQQLEIQQDELNRKMSAIEELRNTSDPLTVLQDQNTEDIRHIKQEDNIDTQIPSEGDFYEGFITDKLLKLSKMMKGFHNWIQQPGAYLDVETAAHDIRISDDQKTVTCGAVYGSFVIPTPKRFHNVQVQSRRSVWSGQHNWEVDTRNSTSWRIGLCYPSMPRASCIGDTNNSWCLQRSGNQYNSMHKNISIPRQTPYPYTPTSQRFRISLDYEAGQISFHELCDPDQHIHTFTATFTEPLHLVIAVLNGSITIAN